MLDHVTKVTDNPAAPAQAGRMATQHPVEILMAEHRQIERVLSALEARTERLGEGAFPRQFYEQAADFFRNFADGCHHFKEEDTLFPALEMRGVRREGGPIGVMVHEHEFGRSCWRTILGQLDAAEAGSAEAIEAVRANASAFVEMLRAHIWKEDQILFQMAYRALDDAAVAQMRRVFEDESNPKINAAVREKYAALADALCGVPATSSAG